LSEKVIFKSK